MDTADKFRCDRCGNCCRVSGYVLLQDGELERIARSLALSPEEFADRYTRLTENRKGLSLSERADHTCVFLASDSTCRIHAVKPRQCASFPKTWRFAGWDRLCRAQRSG